jgi:hypothetical protein
MEQPDKKKLQNIPEDNIVSGAKLKPKFELNSILCYGIIFLLGVGVGFIPCVVILAGLISGVLVATWLKPTLSQSIPKGVFGGLFAVGGSLIPLIYNEQTNPGYESEWEMITGLTGFTAIVVSAWVSSVIVRSRLKAAGLPTTAVPQLKVQVQPAPVLEFAGVAATGDIYYVNCPSCGKGMDVRKSFILGGFNSSDVPHVVNSGHVTRTFSRTANIFVELGIILLAGLVSGNVMVSIFIGIILQLTMTVWGPMLVGILGTTTPVWKITCPACRSIFAAFKEQSILQVTKKTMTDEEIKAL